MSTAGVDRNGFDPFPGPLRFPGPDANPGDLSSWLPMQSTVMEAYAHASQLYLGTKDKSRLTLLSKYGIGDHL